MEPDAPIPISALQHAVYCLRQAALIHLERAWAENVWTAEGQVVHLAAHEPGLRRMKGVRRVTALPLASKRLNLAGTADLVEFIAGPAGETPFPVEYKRGAPKTHRADAVQLCAQALCLEEMTGRSVPSGAIYYAEPKRRTPVAFDAELRTLTERTAADLAALFASGTTPSASYKPSLCRACSLLQLCRPKASRAVIAWRDRQVAAMLADTAQPS